MAHKRKLDEYLDNEQYLIEGPNKQFLLEYNQPKVIPTMAKRYRSRSRRTFSRKRRAPVIRTKAQADRQALANYKRNILQYGGTDAEAVAATAEQAYAWRKGNYLNGARAPIIGRGAYSFGDAGQTLGGMFGERAGAAFGLSDAGRSIGEKIGRIGGSWMGKKVFGRGAYSMNQLIGDHDVRTVQGLGDETGSVVIQNSEYLADISLGTISGFTTQVNYSLNPGLNTTFPWLSQIAQNFEEYEWIGLIFEFRSSLSEGNTSNPNGTVILVTQYNPYNGSFTNKTQMENYDYAQSDKFTNSQYHGVECDPSKNHGTGILSVRTADVPSDQDKRDFDLGNFQLATNTSSSTAVNVGELWVHYHVCLRKSKIQEDTGADNPEVTFTGTLAVDANNMSGCNTVGWTNGYLAGSYEGGIFSIKNALIGSYYLIEINTTGTNITATSQADVSILTGATATNYFPNSTLQVGTSLVRGTTTTNSIQLKAVRATAQTITFSCAGTVGTTTVTRGQIRVTCVASPTT